LYGRDDEKGTVNRQTNAIVLAAARSEIQTGERISLNWELDALGKDTVIGRQSFVLKQWNKAPRIVNDDVWTMRIRSVRCFTTAERSMTFSKRTRI
jgi:hypothetical protein